MGGCVAVVEIYTKSYCGFCWRAKDLFETKNVEFEEIPIDRGGAEREAMIARSGGRTTVPQIFIGGRHVGGCTELLRLEAAGELDRLLASK